MGSLECLKKDDSGKFQGKEEHGNLEALSWDQILEDILRKETYRKNTMNVLTAHCSGSFLRGRIPESRQEAQENKSASLGRGVDI